MVTVRHVFNGTVGILVVLAVGLNGRRSGTQHKVKEASQQRYRTDSMKIPLDVRRKIVQRTSIESR
jgi:hypothetical protein